MTPFDETYKTWGILGIRKDRTWWISNETFFNRSKAVAFKRALRTDTPCKMKVVRLEIARKVISL